ncbi:hypothetical protein F5Y06DRAFT_271969 [Hypoxylon sp. FL0890]|nr:hypothetical protein F5Y06DRAFT_271969 [Hypoxylon sp. FL0890]
MDTTHLNPDQFQLYTRRKLNIVDRTLDDADLETRCPLDNGRHSIQPRQSLGQLDALPLELLTEVLIAIDLPTLTAFRRVNCRAMSIVDSLHQYRMISEHCINVLRAVISLKAASFDCRTLYETLSTRKCEACDRFGSYLYLITCKRVCYFCFTGRPEYHPMSATDAKRCTGLPRRGLMHLPHVLSLTGRYTGFAKTSKKRILLFDQQAVLNTVSESVADAFRRRVRELDLTTRETRRYMSIISAPYFDSSGQLSYWGFYCARCNDIKGRVFNYRNKYTEDDILDHLERHEATGINQRLEDI